MAASTNAFEMAQRQFDHVAALLKLDPQVGLRWPMRGSISVFLCAWMTDNPRFWGTGSAQRCARPEQGRHRFHPLRQWTPSAPWQCGYTKCACRYSAGRR